MINVAWALRSFLFWFVAIGVFCWALERLRPWRREQKVLRKGIGQDVFFLVFNGHFFGILAAHTIAWFTGVLSIDSEQHLQYAGVVNGWPWAAQFALCLVTIDLVEWCVHVALHRVHWLWRFHKLHHSIEELDWIGNFRFHFGEIVVYRTVTFLPLMFLGAQDTVLLATGVFTMFISNLNHANVDISWGPLRYLFNSPRMHVWHHDLVKHGRFGQNYAIVFSLWDWLFGTAYWPDDREHPDSLGFKGMPQYPRSIAGRLLHPFLPKKWRPKRSTASNHREH